MFKLCVSLAALLAVAVAEPSYISPSVLPYTAAHLPAAYPYSVSAAYPGYLPTAYTHPAVSPYHALPAYGALPAVSPYTYPAYNSPLIWKKK